MLCGEPNIYGAGWRRQVSAEDKNGKAGEKAGEIVRDTAHAAVYLLGSVGLHTSGSGLAVCPLRSRSVSWRCAESGVAGKKARMREHDTRTRANEIHHT